MCPKFCLPQSLFSATINGKIPLAFCRRNERNANFCVNLQKFVTAAALRIYKGPGPSPRSSLEQTNQTTALDGGFHDFVSFVAN